MDIMKFLFAVIVWAFFYLVVGIALAFGVRLGWEWGEGIIKKAQEGQDGRANTEKEIPKGDSGGNSKVPDGKVANVQV